MSYDDKSARSLVLLCWLTLLVGRASAQTAYTFVTFTVPNSTYTDAWAINENGDVSGYYGVASTDLFEGFFRTAAGKITTLSYPGATATLAYGINKFGVIAGSWGASAGGGFFYYKGVYRNVVVNGQQTGGVYDINDYGYYVGTFGTSQAFTAFLASPSGQVTTLQYPGGYDTTAIWIKNSGEVIGAYQDQFANNHTFVYNAKSGYKKITVPGKPLAIITDVNSSGVVVGGYLDQGFVYQKGTFQIVLPPGANSSGINAINNKGQLVGSYSVQGVSGYTAFIATPVP